MSLCINWYNCRPDLFLQPRLCMFCCLMITDFKAELASFPCKAVTLGGCTSWAKIKTQSVSATTMIQKHSSWWTNWGGNGGLQLPMQQTLVKLSMRTRYTEENRPSIFSNEILTQDVEWKGESPYKRMKVSALYPCTTFGYSWNIDIKKMEAFLTCCWKPPLRISFNTNLPIRTRIERTETIIN